jgi:hypothetical protein
MKRLTVVVGLMIGSVCPLLAGTNPQVPLKVTYENLTPEQTLERAIQKDLGVISNSGNGGKIKETQLSKADALKALENDRAALEAYKTAGPKAAIPYLEQAIRDDQFAVEHWGSGSKLLTMLQARDAAHSKLAQDQSALNTLKAE